MPGQTHDRDFDTDLLYAYPYGKDMAQKLMSMELFSYDALFYVGRLPIAMDGSVTDLTNYLNRAVQAQLVVSVDRAYTQCDPHWQRVTHAITQVLRSKQLVVNYGDELPQTHVAFKHIVLTPFVAMDYKTGNQDTPFFASTNANLIFFNMHGSNGMDSAGFYGQSVYDSNDWREGMTPQLLAATPRPNILFTQACYGGRFINYPKAASMVLSALSKQTLVYVGSSRTAFGMGDTNEAGVRLSTSDILAKAFLEALLAGDTVGVAFFKARIATFKNAPGNACHALTIGEFNLFGDPTIHTGSLTPSYYSCDKSAPLEKGAKIGVVTNETVMQKSADKPQSLLDQVRSAVDKNIMDIAAVMAKQLYEQYNIPAREPSIVTRQTYADGHKELTFTYPMEAAAGMVNEALVSSTEQGEIIQAVLTK